MMSKFLYSYVSVNANMVVLLAYLSIGIQTTLFAQADQERVYVQEVDLSNLEAFESTTDNWLTADEVFMDTYEDHHVQAEPGSGMLVNTAEGDSPEDIYTSWQHGDIDLELDFMMAKGSNSGIYLQGRYEIQLFDSWGAQTPSFSDVGGIYQWWEDGVGVGGIAPAVNAARAPGVWQHLEIKFRAPRFNEKGEKIAHAKLEEVILNGKVIHTDVKLVHPTGGAISEEETLQGPLRFQGDHGPVAFRNIEYRRYDNEPLRLRNISYRYYERDMQEDEDPAEAINSSYLVESNTADELGLDEVQSSDEFAIVYQGELQIETAGTYIFDLWTNGGHHLSIDGEKLINSESDNSRRTTVELSEGTHNLELIYVRGDDDGSPALSLTAEGPGIERHALHASSAMPAGGQDVDMPKIVDPAGKPIVMHGFMNGMERVYPHSAAVGYPGDLHFGLDLNSGTILKLWKGEFLDMSTMWVDRGGGRLNLDEDAAISLPGAPSLAILNNDQAAWPDSLQQAADYEFNNYRYEQNGHLLFSYNFNGVDIEDRLYPENGNRELRRELTFHTDGNSENVYFRVVAGDSISELPNGLYQVNDKTYLIKLQQEHKQQALIRNTKGANELIVPVSDAEESLLNYSYVW